MKWMLEPAGEVHSEKCGHLNFLSMSLVPAVGWAALLPEPHHQLSLGLVPQVPRGTSAEVEKSFGGLEAPQLCCRLCPCWEQVGYAHGWEPHAALWSLLGCPTHPFLLPRRRVWVALLLACDGQVGRV